MSFQFCTFELDHLRKFHGIFGYFVNIFKNITHTRYNSLQTLMSFQFCNFELDHLRKFHSVFGYFVNIFKNILDIFLYSLTFVDIFEHYEHFISTLEKISFPNIIHIKTLKYEYCCWKCE